MRCADCKHWEKPTGDDWEPIRQTFGRCRHTPHVEDMTQWTDDNDVRRVILPEYEDRTATATDASGYSASLLTKAEHFCAMFTEKLPC